MRWNNAKVGQFNPQYCEGMVKALEESITELSIVKLYV
jgi:hypothetical protein